MKLLLLVVLLTCVIQYQQFVDASNCSSCCESSKSANCNNNSSCNKSKCKSSCSNCGERCAKSNCQNCDSNNTGCNQKQCCGRDPTHNCPTTVSPVVTLVTPTVTPSITTTKVTPITRIPTTDEVKINIQLSNKIVTNNNVDVPIGISLHNRNSVINIRNESDGGSATDGCCTTKPDDTDIETFTKLPIRLTQTIPCVSSTTPKIPCRGCVPQNPCPFSPLYNTNRNPWANYISQFPQAQMGSPYAQLYGSQYPRGQYNQGLPGYFSDGLQGYTR